MSETDNTFECSHCGLSIPNGSQCSCPGARRHVVQAGHPDGTIGDMESRDPTERDEPELEPENDN